MLSRSSPLLLGVKRILTLFFSLSRTGVIYWVKLDGFSLFCEKRERNGIMHPRNRINKTRCCPCFEGIDANKTIFVCALLLFYYSELSIFFPSVNEVGSFTAAT